ncbi:MAG: tRNA adenosine(34) deaminase TadA, partial [Gammaproteobacteria bacterium]|nr:tRNA adenosine(34) deaminase TadA [Gammaproteobacteria bacterium]
MNGDLVAASRSLTKADQHWMSVALEQATEAGGRGEVPVGAVLVLDGQSLGQ